MDFKPVKKAKKGIFHLIFSRITILLVLLLIQLYIFAAVITWLHDYVTYIQVMFLLLEIVSVIYIINSKSNPAFKITWILLIFTLPFFGTAFYIFMKIMPGTGLIQKRLSDLTLLTREYMKQDADTLESLRISKPANANLAHYLSNQVGFPVHRNTAVKYFPSGETKFEEMKAQLRKAQRFIFLEYFIVEDGFMWDSIRNILIEKVKEGVEVRFMYDGMCSMRALPYNYEKQMRKYGIKCKIFSPITPILSSYQNNRDHRKITIIDGKVAYTGGINIGDEYINEEEKFGHWKDTAVKLEGPAVDGFTEMFLKLFILQKGKDFSTDQYYNHHQSFTTNGIVVPIEDGPSPLSPEYVAENVYLNTINQAEKELLILLLI